MRTWQRRNRMNARQTVAGAYAIRSHEAAPGVVSIEAPWGELEHFIDGVQVSAEQAFRARAHRHFKTLT